MKNITLQLFMTLMFVMASWGQEYINEDFQDTDISGGDVTLASGFGKYNYTSDIATGTDNWNSNTVAEKTKAVAVNTASGSGSYVAANVGGQQGLLVHAGNFANADRGIYFTGLDFTGQAIIYFSFDIWGAPVSGDSDIPATLTGWKINLNHGTSSASFDISDSFFGASANVTQNIPFDVTDGNTNPTNVTTFDIIDGQWITISGSFDLTGKNIGSFGAFQIETDTGGFVSSGTPIFAIDNVHVSNMPITLSNESFELNNSIKIYPNPVEGGELHIKNLNPAVKIKRLSLVDMLGKQIYNQNGMESIDVRSFAKGLYILKMDLQDGSKISSKVIIK